MNRFSPDFLKSALGLSHLSDTSFERIVTDSRSAKAGYLFVAVKGEKFDGHDFVAQSARSGAQGAIVSEKNFKDRDQLPSSFVLIEVKDTIQSLRSLAKAYRSQLKIPIVAVAGSNGKTTTKEWIYFLFNSAHGSRFQKAVYKTKKSENSILGIALSLLQIRDEKLAVIEIGIDEPGWMDQHLEVVQPTHGLITTIQEEHLNRLQNIKTVAEEELKLLDYLFKTSGSFVANQDSEWIREKKSIYPPQTLTYGLDQEADIEAAYAAPTTLHAFGISFLNPLPGKHNAQNLLAALSMLRLFHPEMTSADLTETALSLRLFEGEAHRSRLLHLDKNIRVFDDCYNANPSSMEAALKSFIDLTDGCVQHLVVGDMLDLGESSAEAHRRILNIAIVFNFDFVYLFGKEFEKAAAAQQQLPPTFKVYADHSTLIAELLELISPNDTIFVKGSRGMALEKVIEKIEEKFKLPPS